MKFNLCYNLPHYYATDATLVGGGDYIDIGRIRLALEKDLKSPGSAREKISPFLITPIGGFAYPVKRGLQHGEGGTNLYHPVSSIPGSRDLRFAPTSIPEKNVSVPSTYRGQIIHDLASIKNQTYSIEYRVTPTKNASFRSACREQIIHDLPSDE